MTWSSDFKVKVKHLKPDDSFIWNDVFWLVDNCNKILVDDIVDSLRKRYKANKNVEVIIDELIKFKNSNDLECAICKNKINEYSCDEKSIVYNKNNQKICGNCI